ncbi:CotY/CotZ family spore coat protein [Halobacillus massiliensis]|uniref:CotY/CotZ family spore coat protein n=1 Tax=Halobacillus massiliensis TaxID=1926286 RepID=UPI0009E32377|nr:CotY/CotZ family spore coat protein [Halobacillus massiliensis]
MSFKEYLTESSSSYHWEKESSGFYESKDDYKECCKEKKHEKHHPVKHYKNCVEEVLEAILQAQRKAQKGHGCDTSCQQSIHDLFKEEKTFKKNTIPFILYCGCDPFKGTGVTTYSYKPKKHRFKCIESHIFRLKDLKNECAVLELLYFKSDLNDSNEKHCHDKSSACDQIDNKCVSDLIATGICINVDLSCFCGITCLPAVKL